MLGRYLGSFTLFSLLSRDLALGIEVEKEGGVKCGNKQTEGPFYA
jgi:hypothetical protein